MKRNEKIRYYECRSEKCRGERFKVKKDVTGLCGGSIDGDTLWQFVTNGNVKFCPFCGEKIETIIY